LRDAAGKVTQFVAIQRDITERKRFELALAEASRMKSEFLANMSHELRTPLNGIIGFAEFLSDGKPGAINAKQKEYLEDILNSGQHLLHLINDILDIVKIQAGKLELNPEIFRLGDVIQEVRAGVRPIAQNKHIQMRVEISQGLDAVRLDKQRVAQILYNLLSNALKFTDEAGKVGIVAQLEGTVHFRLSVKDSGIGIKPEDIKRLFKEFEQLEAGTDRRFGGTGLGLALTRKIVEMQGGTISVVSEVGKGSTFTVILPLIFREPAETAH
jgi:signal transduction histidine kinase